MSYTIHVRVVQTNPSKWYSIVEKTVWYFANGGTWSELDGEQTLIIGGFGTSGTLRFKNPQGDYFLVTVGALNYERWCDIVVDTSSSHTCMEIHPTYYGGARDMLWKQLPSLEKTSCKGVKVDYYKDGG